MGSMVSPTVDAVQLDRGHVEVAVAELGLDDVERDAFAREFDRVGVAELVRREPASHSGPDRAQPERFARGAVWPRGPARGRR